MWPRVSSARMDSNKKRTFSDINVTPLVDVMLVLLAIFMITAPMMFNGIALTLPKTKKVNNLNLSNKQVILSMTPAGDIYIGKEKFLTTELGEVLRARLAQTKNKIVYIRAHYALQYGKVAKVMGYLKQQGFQNLALVTEIAK